jgi:flagellar biosynthesis protein FliQ
MISVTPVDLPDDTLWRLLPLVVVAVVTPVIVAAIVSFVYAATRKKNSHVIQPETS